MGEIYSFYYLTLPNYKNRKNLLTDIYEVNLKFDCYKIEDAYYVHQWNSYGAGAYEIIWVITKNGIVQRLVSDGI